MFRTNDEWQAREDQVALRREARELADVRAEFEYRRTSGESPAERDSRLYYSLPQACADPKCQHILGMHDVGYGKCYERGCGCAAFHEKQHDRMHMSPAGAPVAKEAA